MVKSFVDFIKLRDAAIGGVMDKHFLALWSNHILSENDVRRLERASREFGKKGGVELLFMGQLYDEAHFAPSAQTAHQTPANLLEQYQRFIDSFRHPQDPEVISLRIDASLLPFNKRLAHYSEYLVNVSIQKRRRAPFCIVLTLKRPIPGEILPQEVAVISARMIQEGLRVDFGLLEIIFSSSPQSGPKAMRTPEEALATAQVLLGDSHLQLSCWIDKIRVVT